MEIVGSIGIVGYGLAVIGSAIGVGIIFMALINGTARQPEARSAMFSSAMIGFAVVEALAILGFVLVFVKG
ncbi:MAG: F0F1 ATP synthase subunit C [Propionibacteriaceae bacterium]|nr:F0F1 ATP synthase subunit C [Propionibacteriaceae bacterium]